MKRKWLIGLLSILMVFAVCFGFAACGDEGGGTEQGGQQGSGTQTDQEIADAAIASLKTLYRDGETASAYTVLGQTKVNGTIYDIVWTVTSTDVTNIGDYVQIGTMDETTKLVKISITKATVEVNYVLKATVTVGEASSSCSFNHNIPAGAVITNADVKFDFSGVKYADYSGTNYGKLSNESATTLVEAAGGANHGLTSVEVDYVYGGTDGKSGGISVDPNNSPITDGYLKLGTGSVDGKLTLNFAKPVNKVVVVAQGWAGKSDTIVVNNAEAQALPTTSNAVTFEIDAAKSIVISTHYRGFIFEIDVYYAPEGTHVHNLGTPEHTDGTWTHKATCSEPGCPVGYVESNCSPEYNVCSECGYEYTAKEIVDKFFAMESGSMPGTYELEGTVTGTPTVYNENWEILMTVEGKTITAYGTKHEGFTTLPSEGDTVKVKGSLTIYGSTYEFNYGTLVEVNGQTSEGGSTTPGGDTGTTNYGTEQKPLSVTEALALAETQCVKNGDYTQEQVYMVGIVKAAPTPSGSYYKNLYLLDENNHETEVLVFSINLSNGVAAPAQNDKLVIHGYITRYKYGDTTGEASDGVIEFSSKESTYVYALSNTRGQSTITLGEHDGATVTGLPQEKTANGTEVTFTVEPASGKKIESVKVNGTKLTATEGSTYKFTVAGDMTVTVDTKDEGAAEEAVVATFNFGENGDASHSDGSSAVDTYAEDDGDYKLNITGGENLYPKAFDAKGNSCLKLGTSKKACTFTFTVPANVTKVVIYVAGYKTNSAAITINGGEAQTISSQSNNGEYTQVEVDTSVTKTVTFATTSAGYRAMIDKIEFYADAPAAAASVETPVAILPGDEH